MPGTQLFIDASELDGKLDKMKKAMTTEQFETMLRRSLRRTGKHIRTIVAKDVPKEYEVPANWVRSQVKSPKVASAGEIGVTVPIKGYRGIIGGRFKLSGSTGKGSIRAKIVKGQTSTMPQRMDHQGGQPPFLVHGSAFTRHGPGRKAPIVRVAGLGVPQMPLNRSEEDVSRDVIDYLGQRLDHDFMFIMRNVK